MPKPSLFTATTDFPTLKNDIVKAGVTVTIPADVIILGDQVAEFYTDVAIGSQGALSSCRISSSKDSNWYRAQLVVYTRTGVTFDGPTSYPIAAFVWRTSTTNLRCQIQILNMYNIPLACEPTPETISFHINTFVPPFA